MKKCFYCERKYWGRINGKGKQLCNRHYMQMRLYGKIFTTNHIERNKIIYKKTYCEMQLRGRKGKIIATTKFDKKHTRRIKKYIWSFDNWGYCRCLKLKTSLHRFILNPPKNMLVDHINGDKLDNRNKNLRLVNKSQNAFNSNRNNLNKLGFRGINLDKRDGYYYPRIRAYGKTYSLGRASTLEEAIKIRKNAELKYFGEYAYKD
jgi:hypothetical protein